MKLSELPQQSEEELELDFCEADDDDDDNGEMETDLCEARELLETCLAQMEGLIRLPRGKKVSYLMEKEMIDLCIEVTGFCQQWDDFKGV